MGVGRARAACPRQGHRFSSSLPIPLLAGEADPVAAATGFQPQEEGERTMAYTRYKRVPYWKRAKVGGRSEEHTSELPSLIRLSYAVFCLIQPSYSSSSLFSPSFFLFFSFFSSFLS